MKRNQGSHSPWREAKTTLDHYEGLLGRVSQAVSSVFKRLVVLLCNWFLMVWIHLKTARDEEQNASSSLHSLCGPWPLNTVDSASATRRSPVSCLVIKLEIGFTRGDGGGVWPQSHVEQDGYWMGGNKLESWALHSQPTQWPVTDWAHISPAVTARAWMFGELAQVSSTTVQSRHYGTRIF